MKYDIAFIVYGDDEWIISENIDYINSLIIPEGLSIEIIKVIGNEELSDKLEAGRVQTNAKVKIYLNQNSYIIDKNFVLKILKAFEDNPKVGIIGTRGCYKNIDTDKIEFIGNNLYQQYGLGSQIGILKEGYEQGIIETLAIDNHIMITAKDTPWGGNSSNANIVKSVELRHMGYNTAVIVEDNPMVLFDNGILKEN